MKWSVRLEPVGAMGVICAPLKWVIRDPQGGIRGASSCDCQYCHTMCMRVATDWARDDTRVAVSVSA